jgi:hypothetical protein
MSSLSLPAALQVPFPRIVQPPYSHLFQNPPREEAIETIIVLFVGVE